MNSIAKGMSVGKNRMCNDNATLIPINGYQIVTLQSITAAVQHNLQLPHYNYTIPSGVFVHSDEYFAVWFIKSTNTSPKIKFIFFPPYHS